MTKILAITGGVGGAKLALGLSKILSDKDVLFLVNTGDDFQHLGLEISPDIDSLLYALRWVWFRHFLDQLSEFLAVSILDV